MEILPVINCSDKECLEQRVQALHTILPSGGWVHVDVADGRITFHKPWVSPEWWEKVGMGLKLEVHLMVEEPEEAVKVWLRAGAKRVIVHLETVANVEHIAALCKGAGAALMLSVNPETSVERLRPYFDAIREYQVLAVNPGLAGQKFLPLTMEKVRVIRRDVPEARIEVDGGIIPETARIAKAAGADAATSSSFIFDNEDPKLALAMLAQI